MFLDELIKSIEQRDGAFLGNDHDIKSLSHFIDGFVFSNRVNNIRDERGENFRLHFREYVISCYNDRFQNGQYYVSNLHSWYEIIRFMAYESDRNELKLFFELYHGFCEKTD